ncbi:hypothetical protein WDU94_010388 [Cyamophila willieti]
MDLFNVRDYLDEARKESNEESEIQRFYANKTIFITGASGFVGTLVLEKLLRTCKDLHKVYVLFRSSRQKNIHERLVAYFNDPVFYRMKTENPTYFTQVTCVQGDLSLDQLGLSAEDRQVIVDNTQVILHVAATVKFNEQLADAYNINVKGTKSLIHMAEHMKQLHSFVYVSTAYSNCDSKHIEEKFYDPVFSDEETVTVLQHSQRDEQAIILPHILGLFFSMAERYLNREPMIMKIYRKLFFLYKTVRYFVFNDWSFTNDNTKSLLLQLNTRDRELFDFNMASFDWHNYYSVLYRSSGVYILKAYTNKDNYYPKEMYKRKMKYIEPIDRAIIWIFWLAAVCLSYNVFRVTFLSLISYL